MIDHQRKFIHIHIPKTGGTSIHKTLLPEAQRTLHEFASDFTVDEWENYYTFAFVRNPFDRTVSHYAYHVKSRYGGVLARRNPDLKELSFQEYLERFVVPQAPANFASQVRFITHDRTDVKIDFVGRFERLAADFEVVKKALGVDVELPHLLKSRHDSYRSYYDDTTRRMVEESYGEDLEAFGYAF